MRSSPNSSRPSARSRAMRSATPSPIARLLLQLHLVELLLLDDLVDLLLGEGPRRVDRDGLLLAGGEVARRHAHDAVRVDVEGDVDLGLALAGRADAGEH